MLAGAPSCLKMSLSASTGQRGDASPGCTDSVSPLWLSVCLFPRVVKEEISDDNAKLPCFNGRVVSWVSEMDGAPLLPLALLDARLLVQPRPSQRCAGRPQSFSMRSSLWTHSFVWCRCFHFIADFNHCNKIHSGVAQVDRKQEIIASTLTRCVESHNRLLYWLVRALQRCVIMEDK